MTHVCSWQSIYYTVHRWEPCEHHHAENPERELQLKLFYYVGGFVFSGTSVGDGVGFGCGRGRVYQMFNEFWGCLSAHVQ